jgi:hypothetical protein
MNYQGMGTVRYHRCGRNNAVREGGADEDLSHGVASFLNVPSHSFLKRKNVPLLIASRILWKKSK